MPARSLRRRTLLPCLAVAALLVPAPAPAVLEWVGDVAVLTALGFQVPPGTAADALIVGLPGSGQVSLNPTGGTLVGGSSVVGSSFTWESLSVGGAPILGSGTGVLTVSGSGQSASVAPQVGSTSLAGVGWNGVGTLNVDDGALFTFDLTGNPATSAGLGGSGGGIGVEPLSQGFVNVTGGSTLRFVGAELRAGVRDGVGSVIGNQGAGSVSVSGGSSLVIESNDADLGGLSLGLTPGSSGTLSVSGAGSSLVMAGDRTQLDVGQGGSGIFDLTGGATGGSKLLFAGLAAGSQGTLGIGAGSTYTVSGAVPVGNLDFPSGQGAAAVLGVAGTATANVAGQLVVDASAGGSQPGLALGSSFGAGGGTGTLNVTGPAGSVEVIAAGTSVGVDGTGILTVTGGAQMSAGSVLAVGQASFSPGSGTVTVSGPGSLLDAGFGTAIALVPGTPTPTGGTGVVCVSDGATLVSPITGVGPGGVLCGNGTVEGSVFNLGGLVSPGLSPGTITFTGDFEMTSGELEIEVDGTGAGEFDVVAVLGSASVLGGTIRFLVDPGVDLSTGLSIPFLTVPDPLTDLVLDPSVVATALQGGIAIPVSLALSATGLGATIVPEPGTGLLLAAGLIGLAGRPRRQRG